MRAHGLRATEVSHAIAHTSLVQRAGPLGPLLGSSCTRAAGGISRFAGLSVRRAVASRLAQGATDSGGGSPGRRLQDMAEAELTDAPGHSPWWVARGASTQSVFLAVPDSEQPFRMATPVVWRSQRRHA